MLSPNFTSPSRHVPKHSACNNSFDSLNSWLQVAKIEISIIPRARAEEILGGVKERAEAIGPKPRREVHRLGLMHRAVHVLVFNSRGQVFLQKRSLTKDRQRGLWDSSASGHLDSGEDYDACAVREVREEIGLELKRAPLRLFKLAAGPETD